jgi:hypothetical protein
MLTAVLEVGAPMWSRPSWLKEPGREPSAICTWQEWPRVAGNVALIMFCALPGSCSDQWTEGYKIQPSSPVQNTSERPLASDLCGRKGALAEAALGPSSPMPAPSSSVWTPNALQTQSSTHLSLRGCFPIPPLQDLSVARSISLSLSAFCICWTASNFSVLPRLCDH